MSHHRAKRFAFKSQSILNNVPTASGVYTLHSQSGCVYVGKGEDICASLLVHVHDKNPCLDRRDPIYFTFEPVGSEAQESRQAELVMELHPSCYRREDYPECEGCSLAQKLASCG